MRPKGRRRAWKKSWPRHLAAAHQSRWHRPLNPKTIPEKSAAPRERARRRTQRLSAPLLQRPPRSSQPNLQSRHVAGADAPPAPRLRSPPRTRRFPRSPAPPNAAPAARAGVLPKKMATHRAQVGARSGALPPARALAAARAVAAARALVAARAVAAARAARAMRSKVKASALPGGVGAMSAARATLNRARNPRLIRRRCI